MSTKHKNKNPLVSVIIPLYNNEELIGDCVNSVLNQSYKNIEIIIVDDGSTDASFEIVRKMAKLHPQINIFSNSNNGAAFSRNFGISQSKGEFIQFLDSDDLLSEEKIERQVEVLQNSLPNVLCFSEYSNFRNGKEYLIRNRKINKSYVNPERLLIDMWKHREFIPIHSYLIPNKTLEISGIWNEKLTNNDDGEFMARVILASEKVVFVPDCRVIYVYKPNSLSKNKHASFFYSRFTSYNLILNHFKSQVRDEILVNTFLKYYNFTVSEMLVELRTVSGNVFLDIRTIYGNPKKLQVRFPIFNIFKMLLGEKRALRLYNKWLMRFDRKLKFQS